MCLHWLGLGKSDHVWPSKVVLEQARDELSGSQVQLLYRGHLGQVSETASLSPVPAERGPQNLLGNVFKCNVMVRLHPDLLNKILGNTAQ